MCTPHMPLFQIGVTFFEYVAWLYSGMSAVWCIKSAQIYQQLLAQIYWIYMVCFSTVYYARPRPRFLVAAFCVLCSECK
jgi:hypothetical protein